MGFLFERQFAILIFLLALSNLSSATISFPDIQLIVGFSSSCTQAYAVPVRDCNYADLSGIGGTGSCSTTCRNNIHSAQTTIKEACSRDSADSSSLLGMFFEGSGVTFLCGAMSTTTTETTRTSVASTASTASNTNVAQTTATQASTTMSSVVSPTTSSDSQSSTAPTTTASLTTISEVSTSISTSTADASSSTSSSATASQTTAPRSNGGSGGGGGSPFDPPVAARSAGVMQAYCQPYLVVLAWVLASMILR